MGSRQIARLRFEFRPACVKCVQIFLCCFHLSISGHEPGTLTGDCGIFQFCALALQHLLGVSNALLDSGIWPTYPGQRTEVATSMARDLKWSHTEKGIACKAFERALERKFEAVIRTAKEMAGKIEQPADLWAWSSIWQSCGRTLHYVCGRNGSFSRPRTPRAFYS